MGAKDLTLEVIEIFRETHDVKTIRFRLDKPLNFKAGQFLMLYINLTDRNGKIENVKRPYSIASSPDHKDWIDINFRVYSFGRFTPSLFNLKIGDKIKAKGPYGIFTYEEGESKNVVFLAAGTGIAPLRGIIKFIEEKNLDVNMILFSCCKTTEDMIFDKEFKKLAEENENFKYIPTITRINECKKEWRGEKGRINIEMIKNYIKDLKRQLFYICGPNEMVKDSRDFLISESVNPKKIKIEKFH